MRAQGTTLAAACHTEESCGRSSSAAAAANASAAPSSTSARRRPDHRLARRGRRSVRDGVVVVVPAADVEREHGVAGGGDAQRESVRAGWRRCPTMPTIICVHDAARPLATPDAVPTAVIDAVPAAPTAPCRACRSPTRSRSSTATATSRASTRRTARRSVAVQTPQAFRAAMLRRAHAGGERHRRRRARRAARRARRRGAGRAVEPQDHRAGRPRVGAPSSRAERAMTIGAIRVGQGFDVHRFGDDPTAPLVLGGCRSRADRGLDGHSDGDAVAHAVADALLGAAGLGDIGQHFPDTDPALGGRRLDRAASPRRRRSSVSDGWAIGNVDCSVVCERPKLAPRRDEMQRRLSDAVGAPVTVKGRRAEGLGAIGRVEGIACWAVAVITGTRMSAAGRGKPRSSKASVEPSSAATPVRDRQRVRPKPAVAPRSQGPADAGPRPYRVAAPVAPGRSGTRRARRPARRAEAGQGSRRRAGRGPPGRPRAADRRSAARSTRSGSRRDLEGDDGVEDIVALAAANRVPSRRRAHASSRPTARSEAPQGVLALRRAAARGRPRDARSARRQGRRAVPRRRRRRHRPRQPRRDHPLLRRRRRRRRDPAPPPCRPRHADGRQGVGRRRRARADRARAGAAGHAVAACATPGSGSSASTTPPSGRCSTSATWPPRASASCSAPRGPACRGSSASAATSSSASRCAAV